MLLVQRLAVVAACRLQPESLQERSHRQYHNHRDRPEDHDLLLLEIELDSLLDSKKKQRIELRPAWRKWSRMHLLKLRDKSKTTPSMSGFGNKMKKSSSRWSSKSIKFWPLSSVLSTLALLLKTQWIKSRNNYLLFRHPRSNRLAVKFHLREDLLPSAQIWLFASLSRRPCYRFLAAALRPLQF